MRMSTFPVMQFQPLFYTRSQWQGLDAYLMPRACFIHCVDMQPNSSPERLSLDWSSSIPNVDWQDDVDLTQWLKQ
jgi:hypothetical protein